MQHIAQSSADKSNDSTAEPLEVEGTTALRHSKFLGFTELDTLVLFSFLLQDEAKAADLSDDTETTQGGEAERFLDFTD